MLSTTKLPSKSLNQVVVWGGTTATDGNSNPKEETQS